MIPTPAEFKRRRQLIGLTQKQIASKLQIAQSIVSKFESGKSMPGYNVLKILVEGIENLERHSDEKVAQFMTKIIISITSDKSIHDAIKIIKKHQVSQIPVIDDGVVGMITERSLLGILDYDSKVSAVMEPAPPIFPITASKKSIKEILKYYSMILVTDGQKVVGVVSRQDVL